MEQLVAERMKGVKRSFIREILKVTKDPEIISFAGGLPNPAYFPSDAVADAADRVLRQDGPSALQYSTTEGFEPLRAYIADRYARKEGLDVEPSEVLITTGSQQALDLLGKVFLNQDDALIIERPGYLGAIQSFSMYGPRFVPVPMDDDGVDPTALGKAVADNHPKMFYAVPNFQNPSGVTYTLERRRAAAEIIAKSDAILVEDDPYGALRFIGEKKPLISSMLPKEKRILLGTFSKTVAPGFRIGWMIAPASIMPRLVTAKQAADLHTSSFGQRVLHDYLASNDPDKHIRLIREAYGRQREIMVQRMEELFPSGVRITKPEGGMFLWVELPQGVKAMTLFDAAIRRKVAFVPGMPFYVDGGGDNTMRVNFSNSNPERINEGVARLAAAMREFLG